MSRLQALPHHGSAGAAGDRAAGAGRARARLRPGAEPARTGSPCGCCCGWWPRPSSSVCCSTSSPNTLGGRPLLAGDVLALVLVPLLLAGLVLAMLRLRLNEIDAAVRRSLVAAGRRGPGRRGVPRGVRASWAGPPTRPSGRWWPAASSALLLVPVALAVRRAVITVVYGDRDFPYRVVSDLRRLDPAAPPEEALRETLEVLARSLRLSYASIEVAAGPGTDRISTSIGEPRGQQTAIDLSAGGAALGVLRLEVDPVARPVRPPRPAPARGRGQPGRRARPGHHPQP